MLKSATIKEFRQDVMAKIKDPNTPADTAFHIKIKDHLKWYQENGKLFVCHKSYACKDFDWYFLRVSDTCTLNYFHRNAFEYFEEIGKDIFNEAGRSGTIIEEDDQYIFVKVEGS